MRSTKCTQYFEFKGKTKTQKLLSLFSLTFSSLPFLLCVAFLSLLFSCFPLPLPSIFPFPSLLFISSSLLFSFSILFLFSAYFPLCFFAFRLFELSDEKPFPENPFTDEMKLLITESRQMADSIPDPATKDLITAVRPNKKKKNQT